MVPPQRPRLQSLTAEEEQLVYSATDEPFGNFLFAALHTGLRPFCELARLKAKDVEETERGMMWRVYSSKTKKTRKIPVRMEVADLTRRLIATVPKDFESTLFRNAQGRPRKKVTTSRELTLPRSASSRLVMASNARGKPLLLNNHGRPKPCNFRRTFRMGSCYDQHGSTGRAIILSSP